MRLTTLRHKIFCSTRLTQTSKYDALFWTTYTTFKGHENWKWMFWSYVYAVDETGLRFFRWLLGALVCRAHRLHIKIDCLCMVASMYHYSNMTSRANKSLAWRVRQNIFGHLCYWSRFIGPRQIFAKQTNTLHSLKSQLWFWPIPFVTSGLLAYPTKT